MATIFRVQDGKTDRLVKAEGMKELKAYLLRGVVLSEAGVEEAIKLGENGVKLEDATQQQT